MDRHECEMRARTASSAAAGSAGPAILAASEAACTARVAPDVPTDPAVPAVLAAPVAPDAPAGASGATAAVVPAHAISGSIGETFIRLGVYLRHGSSMFIHLHMFCLQEARWVDECEIARPRFS